MGKVLGMTLEEEILEAIQECIRIRIFEDRITAVDIEEIIEMKIMKEVGVGLRERSYTGNIKRNDRSNTTSRSRSGARVTTNRDRIRCYKCREYDHFVKNCPATIEERGTDQIQQMFNLDEEKTSLKTLTIGTYDSLNCVSSLEEIRSEHVNLWKVRRVPPHFCL